MDKIFYKDFQSIEVPSFLLEWEDTSWGNDVTASSEKKLSDGFSLVVWVNPDEIELREMWEEFKYCVILQDEDRNEVRGMEVKTDEEAIEAIRELESYYENNK